MKNCENCGNELMEEANFCAKCGSEFNEKTTASSTQGMDTEAVKEKIEKTYNQAKGSIKKSGYFEYFKKTIKSPTVSINSGKSHNGLIHFGVLSLVTVLSIYFIISAGITVAMNQTEIAFLSALKGSLMSQVNDFLPNLLMMSITAYGVFIFSAYMMLKFLVKEDISFSQTLTEFGGLFTPNIILLSAAAILTFLIKTENTLTIGVLIVAFSSILMFIALNYFIFKKSNNKSTNTFYILLISNILVFIIFSYIVYIQVEPIFTAIDNLDTLGW